MEQLALLPIHKNGPPWETVAKYENYEQADKKRNEIIKDKEYQVKIH